MDHLYLNIADRVCCTEAEGPGRRFALWVQGCPMRCPGCCNPHMLEDKIVESLSVTQVAEEIFHAQDAHGIEGVTFVGGEPFAQADALGALAEIVKGKGLSVMVFSGFTYDRLLGSKTLGTRRLLAATDLLISGPYVRELYSKDRRWIGSSNQEIHFLSARYAGLRDREGGWNFGENTIEIRFKDGEILVNGFPHPELHSLLSFLAERDP